MNPSFAQIIFGLGGLATVLARSNPASGAAWVYSTDSNRWVTHDRVSIAAYDGTTHDLVEVKPDVKYQQIDGFGGCFNELGWAALQTISASDRNQVMQELFGKSGCNFTICRMPIGASDFALKWYSLDDTAGDLELKHFSIERDTHNLIPYIKSALEVQPSLKVWGSPWSPPEWMKNNNNYAGGNIRWEPPVLTAYAAYFSKYIQEYQKAGIPIYAIHVQNEPKSAQVFPSCQWTGEHMRDFIRDYLAPRFKTDKIKAEIWLGTINDGDVKKYAVPVLSDPAAAALITGVGYQWDGRDAIAYTHEKWPDKKLMQTETECGGGQNDWNAAQHTWGLIKHYLSNGANSYMYWNMVLDESNNSTWNWKQNAMITINRPAHKVRYNPEFYLMKHLTRFVKAGAYRIEATGDWPEKLAFRNPDGGLVVLLVNTNDEQKTVTLRLGQMMAKISVPARSFGTFTEQK